MRIGTLVKLCFGLALLGVLLMMADFHAIQDMAKQMDIGYATAGMLAFLVTGILDMVRLRLASPATQKFSWGALSRMHLESYIMAQLLPGHMGMDAYRIAMIGKNQKRYVEPAVVTFGLRVFSLLTMLLMAIVLVLFLSEWQVLYLPYMQRLFSLPFWLLAACTLGTGLVLLAAYRLFRRLWHKLQQRLGDVADAYNALTASLISWLVLLSLLIIVTRIVTFLFALHAFGIEIGWLVASSVAIFATLSWLLPLSPAGVGVREGVIIGLLVWFDVAFEPALMVALLNRVYFIALAICGGVSFLLPNNGGIERDAYSTD